MENLSQYLTNKQLNSIIVPSAWKKYTDAEQASVKIYSNFDYYSGIVNLGRLVPDSNDLAILKKTIIRKKLTVVQKEFLAHFSRTSSKTERTISGEEMLLHFANLQKAAKKYKIKSPLLLLRRVNNLNFFKELKKGDEVPLHGITSTFATLEAFNDPRIVKTFGSAIIKFQVPVGVYCIPIGNKGTSWHSLDEIALPHGTGVKVLSFQTGKNPQIVVAVLPGDVVLF